MSPLYHHTTALYHYTTVPLCHLCRVTGKHQPPMCCNADDDIDLLTLFQPLKKNFSADCWKGPSIFNLTLRQSELLKSYIEASSDYYASLLLACYCFQYPHDNGRLLFICQLKHGRAVCLSRKCVKLLARIFPPKNIIKQPKISIWVKLFWQFFAATLSECQ